MGGRAEQPADDARARSRGGRNAYPRAADGDGRRLRAGTAAHLRRDGRARRAQRARDVRRALSMRRAAARRRGNRFYRRAPSAADDQRPRRDPDRRENRRRPARHRHLGAEHRRQNGRAQDGWAAVADGAGGDADSRADRQQGDGVSQCVRRYRRRAIDRVEPVELLGPYRKPVGDNQVARRAGAGDSRRAGRRDGPGRRRGARNRPDEPSRDAALHARDRDAFDRREAARILASRVRGRGGGFRRRAPCAALSTEAAHDWAELRPRGRAPARTARGNNPRGRAIDGHRHYRADRLVEKTGR